MLETWHLLRRESPFCHVQHHERLDAKNTYVYDCMGSDEPTENPNIWMCVSRHKCEEICPYEVSPIRFMRACMPLLVQLSSAYT